MPTARRRSSPARSSSGRASSPRCAQIAAEELDLPLARINMISGDTGADAERRPDRRQPVDREQRHRAAHGVRRSARDPARPRGQAARRRGRHAHASPTASSARPTAARSAMANLPPTLDLNREATAKAAPKPPASHKIVGKSIPRFDIPAKVTGGAAYVQDIRLPGMVHGRVVRPPRYGAKLDSVDEAAAQGDAGRDRGGARRQLPRRRRRARGAGDQGARRACASSAKWTRRPGAARSRAHLRACSKRCRPRTRSSA